MADTNQQTRDSVKEYYGKILKKQDDLQTNACCCAELPPSHIQRALEKIHCEVLERYYGCGLTIPDLLEGLTVVDLGSGSGRDCYVLSQLVGEKGHVIGVDMTDEQLEVARRHIDYHTKEFGYAKPNVEFKKGYIEDLAAAGIASNSVDLIVSNCVVNLSPDKDAVLREAFRVLKNGGEMFFSDVYADRRVPDELRSHKALYGECISGALYWNDFINKAKKAGFTDPRLVTDHEFKINNPALEKLVGHIRFFSATYRLFKLPDLESDCEDYGQAVIYRGTIPQSPKKFALDGHHLIETGKVFLVCGNTFSMLQNTRFAPHFNFIGDRNTHYGIYDGCGKGLPFGKSQQKKEDKGSCAGGSCC